MYCKVFKRIFDFVIAFFALIILSPFFIVLASAGFIAMGGNPFFVQLRPGKKDKNGNEKLFYLIKFRTMSNKKDQNGNLLSDELRLNKYGRFLRSTSLDEIPEFINILKGDMSFVGPRPLLVEYIPYYTETERKRHDVKPGLTGWAQVNGRNAISWDLKLAFDVEYISAISFAFDIKIIFKTIAKVVKRSDIQVGESFTGGKFIDQRKQRLKEAKKKEEHNVN